jgi:hypothetical protein
MELAGGGGSWLWGVVMCGGDVVVIDGGGQQWGVVAVSVGAGAVAISAGAGVVAVGQVKGRWWQSGLGVEGGGHDSGVGGVERGR